MNVLIIDDDKLVAASLKTILQSDPEMNVIGIGHNGLDAIALYDAHHPDILLMDIRMNEMNGLDAAKVILAKDPSAKILFLTTFSDDEYIVKALKMGAKGYLLKQNFESIIPSIKTVYIGQRVFGDEIMTKIPTFMNDGTFQDAKYHNTFQAYDLTEKEIELMTHVAEGLSNKEIADIVCLGEGTVRNYISLILEKLQLRDRTQLAIFYYKNL